MAEVRETLPLSSVACTIPLRGLVLAAWAGCGRLRAVEAGVFLGCSAVCWPTRGGPGPLLWGWRAGGGRGRLVGCGALTPNPGHRLCGWCQRS